MNKKLFTIICPSYYLVLVYYLVLALSFTACTRKIDVSADAESQKKPSVNATPTPVVAAPTIQPGSDALATGKILYANYCASCHGALPNSNRIGKTLNDITNGIANIQSMNYLSILTSEQISMIALALDPSANSQDVNAGVNIKAVVGNRYQTVSMLSNMFIGSGVPDTNDNLILSYINSLVLNHPEGFGGNCNRNDPACLPAPCAGDGYCKGRLDTSQNAELNPSASAIRKGYLIQVCEKILSVNKAITNLGSNAAIDISKSPDLVAVTKLINYMHRNRPEDSTSANQLVVLSTSLSSKAMSISEQWGFIMLALCQSSTVELL